MQDRIDEWNARQELLVALLRANGAEGHEFRVDLGLGRFWWQDPSTGKPSVVAETKVLGSWALSNHSVLAGWENSSLPPSAVTEPIEGVEARTFAADESAAWDWALSIAEGAGAHFVYRVPNAQSWIFLGLWSVRAAGPDEEAFEPGPPWDHVRRVVDDLRERDLDRRRALVCNYGRTFVEDRVHRGTRWERPLREIGEALIRLGENAPDETALDAGLDSILARVPRAN